MWQFIWGFISIPLAILAFIFGIALWGGIGVIIGVVYAATRSQLKKRKEVQS